MIRVLALVLAVLIAPGASAQEEPRWALVIGNNDYEYIPDLGAAVNDAVTMAATLKELGFTVIEAPNLTRAGMYRAVRRLQESAAGAVVIVYYAGHGVQIGGRNYLLPVDIEAGSEAEVEDNAVPIDDVLNLLVGARAKLTVAFLDACRDNPLPASLRTASQGMAEDRRVPRGQMVVYSAGPGERAVDNLGRGDDDPNGLFVRELIPELKRAGVPLDRAIEAAAARISAKAQAIGHDQNPAIYKAYYGDFFLRPGPVVGNYGGRDRAAFDAIRDSPRPGDLAVFLEHFPGSALAPIVRNRLEELEAKAHVATEEAVRRAAAEEARRLERARAAAEREAHERAGAERAAAEEADRRERERRVAERTLVRRAQNALAALGFDVGRADGVPGRRTRDALAAYRERAGLPVEQALSEELVASLEEAAALEAERRERARAEAETAAAARAEAERRERARAEAAQAAEIERVVESGRRERESAAAGRDAGARTAVEPPAALPSAAGPPPPTQQQIALVPDLPRPAAAPSYRLQLLQLRSEGAMNQAWSQLQQRYPGVLRGLAPSVERIATVSGTVYRLQAGPFGSRDAATDACAAIQRQGGQCFVVSGLQGTSYGIGP